MDVIDAGSWIKYGWKVEQGQLDRIKEGDREALFSFWTDNHYKLRRYAYRYCIYKGLPYNDEIIEEYVNQSLLDIPFMDLTNPKVFLYTLHRRSFPWMPYGGYDPNRPRGSRETKTVIPKVFMYDSLESKDHLDVDGSWFLDKHFSSQSAEEEFIEKEAHREELTAKQIVDKLCDAKLVTKTNVGRLVRMMNCEHVSTTEYREALDKLIINYKDVLSVLQEDFPELVQVYRDRIPAGYERALNRAEARRVRIRERDRANKEANRLRVKEWREKNRAKLLEQRRRYREQKKAMLVSATASTCQAVIQSATGEAVAGLK